jgi:hypothetical protein
MPDFVHKIISFRGGSRFFLGGARRNMALCERCRTPPSRTISLNSTYSLAKMKTQNQKKKFSIFLRHYSPLLYWFQMKKGHFIFPRGVLARQFRALLGQFYTQFMRKKGNLLSLGGCTPPPPPKSVPEFHPGMFAFSSQILLLKVCEYIKSGHTFGHCVITSYGHVVLGYSEKISDGSQTQLLWSWRLYTCVNRQLEKWRDFEMLYNFEENQDLMNRIKF